MKLCDLEKQTVNRTKNEQKTIENGNRNNSKHEKVEPIKQDRSRN